MTAIETGNLKLIGKSRTSPTEMKQGKVCYADVFKLTDLPDIMEKAAWKRGATLMRKWLSSDAYAMSDEEKRGLTDARLYPAALTDCSTLTMEWLLSFPRAKKEYDLIFGKKAWIRSTPPLYESEPARRELVKKLVRSGKFSNRPEAFGDFKDAVTAINELSQFQIKKVGERDFKVQSYGAAAMNELFFSDPDLDDLWVACADFLFKIAGEGVVIPGDTASPQEQQSYRFHSKWYEVVVNNIGVFARDTYDFNGTQYLGHWRKTKQPFVRLYALGESRGTCPDDYLIVNNQKFTAHREETGKGGDLMVFSDIRTTKLRTPYRFRLTSKDIQSILLQSHAT